MSVVTEIQRLKTCVENAYTACSSKGATMPAVSAQNTNNLPSTIQSIGAAVVDADVIPKYGLEEYSSQVDELTAKNIDITLTGRFADIEYIDDSFNGAFRSNYVELNSQVIVPRRKIHGDVEFTKLTEINGSFSDVFRQCEFDQGATVSFPSLFTVGRSNLTQAFIRTFQNAKNIGTVSFGMLSDIQKSWQETFMGSDVSQVLFPQLVLIGPDGSLGDNTFRQCLNLTSMSFPNLTTINNVRAFAANEFSYQYAFYGCTNLIAIHFRADVQSIVEALDGYSSMFGATNATIYFDL